MAHRKWKESKQQPSMLPSPAVPGCCLISFHFLSAIHPIRPVQVEVSCKIAILLGKLWVGNWSLAFYFLGSHSHQPKEQLRHAVSAPVFDCHAEFRSCRDLNGAIARWRLKSAKYEKANRTGDEKEGIYKVCWHLSEFGMRYSVKILSESQNKFSNIWFWTPWLPVIHLVPSGMRYTQC